MVLLILGLYIFFLVKPNELYQKDTPNNNIKEFYKYCEIVDSGDVSVLSTKNKLIKIQNYGEKYGYIFKVYGDIKKLKGKYCRSFSIGLDNMEIKVSGKWYKVMPLSYYINNW
jgi:hypothetical protein